MSDAQIRKLWAEINRLNKKVAGLEKQIETLQGQSANATALVKALNPPRKADVKVSPEWRPYLRQETRNVVIELAKQYNVNPSVIVNNLIEEYLNHVKNVKKGVSVK